MELGASSAAEAQFGHRLLHLLVGRIDLLATVLSQGQNGTRPGASPGVPRAAVAMPLPPHQPTVRQVHRGHLAHLTNSKVPPGSGARNANPTPRSCWPSPP